MAAAQDSIAGKLKIGDNWNAITIIALSQNNPLKAIAEFVENSIDAKAKNISIIRGKKQNEMFLRIIDDGEGITDLKYVATHIGDSIKRKLKSSGETGIQGEFGIGLLSFWIVGEELTITTVCEAEEKPRKMKLVKGHPGYSISTTNHLFAPRGTELSIRPILPGIRNLSGERIQNYLASELRDRISKNSVRIVIHDKLSRKQYLVEPRKFHGHLLHNIPDIWNPHGEIYCELYINEPSAENELGLYKHGTRVFPRISALEHFSGYPWNSPYLEGIIDCSFLQLTPGTRDGVILDDQFSSFAESLAPLRDFLDSTIKEQKRAEEEQASRTILSKISKAFRNAFTYLADQDYSWLNIEKRRSGTGGVSGTVRGEDGLEETSEREILPGYPEPSDDLKEAGGNDQKMFFDYPGPLHKIVIVPSKSVISINTIKKFKAVCRDKRGKEIEHGVEVVWSLIQGDGLLESSGVYAEFLAGADPGAAVISAEATDGESSCSAETIVTVTAELIAEKEKPKGPGKGLPGYTYQNAPGELWRSKYDSERNIIVINNGHQDFIYASKLRARQLRYIAKLFAKEMILFNFPGIKPEESLERMSELLLYIEENLS